MSEEIIIVCENCLFWKSQHCENFSSKWFGMVVLKTQNCGKFKEKKAKKKEKQKTKNDEKNHLKKLKK